MASRREADRVPIQNLYLFKSRQANAPTITTLCTGDSHGRHFTQINLQPQQIADLKDKLGKRNGSQMLFSTLNSSNEHWEYARHLFEDLDIKDFLKGERWKVQPKPFPPPAPDLEPPPPPAPVDADADESEDESHNATIYDQLCDIRARILRLAENVDEYSLHSHRADIAKSQKTSAQTRLNSIADEIIALAKQASATLQPSSSETVRTLVNTIQDIASSQTPIIRKLISNIATVARKGKLPAPTTNTTPSIQHFLLRIKSSFRADSAITYLKLSEDSKWSLLDSFHIDFMPYSQNSLYMSIAMAAQHARSVYSALPTQVAVVQPDGTLRDGEENFGVLPQLATYLPPTKQNTVLLQSFVRNLYPKLSHLPVAPGNLTFAEYIERKGRNSRVYSEMPSDHVLCETALIARACCINIAVLWHVRGLWKTFLLPHGPQSNIVLVVLYTNMGVEQAPTRKDSREVRLQPCDSPCNRFFPLYPFNSSWIKNPIFKPAVPQSQDPAVTASIVAKLGHFDKRRNKESILSATVDVSGSECSPDTASEATADATLQQWMADGFIDDDFVDQTPPSEFALEEQRAATATAATNELHLECILEVFRRKTHPRVDDSDLDELLNLGTGAGAAGAPLK